MKKVVFSIVILFFINNAFAQKQTVINVVVKEGSMVNISAPTDAKINIVILKDSLQNCSLQNCQALEDFPKPKIVHRPKGILYNNNNFPVRPVISSARSKGKDN